MHPPAIRCVSCSLGKAEALDIPDTMTSADARYLALQAHLAGNAFRVHYWKSVAIQLKHLEQSGLRAHLPSDEDRFAVTLQPDVEESASVAQPQGFLARVERDFAADEAVSSRAYSEA